MRKSIRTTMIAGAVLAATVGMTATPAMADATWTVSPGGDFIGFAGTTTLKDEGTGTQLTCESSDASGTAKSGSGHAGAGLASINSLNFNDCTGPLSITFGVTSGNLPWALNADTYNAGTGVTTGTITGIQAKLSGPGCSADVGGPGGASTTGTVVGTYDNNSGELAISGGNLHLWNVSGCFGLVGSGNASTFTGTYVVDPTMAISMQ
jgi:hypothetical protein